MKIAIRPQWVLGGHETAPHFLPRLVALLAAVEAEGSLVRAARALAISYRHAWGLLRDGAREFRAPLVVMSRGRGASLSPLGEKLVWAERRVQARLAPLLESLAHELETQVDSALHDPRLTLRVRASHGFAIDVLREVLEDAGVPVALRFCGSMESLAALAAGDCEIAGFHAPLGPLQREALPFYARWLRPGEHRLVVLCARRQGLMVPHGNPGALLSVADLARPGLRFANRQFGSGTRILLDLLLAGCGIDSRAIAGYETGEFTHSGVAACVASGIADAGFGVETAARRYGLDFVPVAAERYFLLCRTESLASPFMACLLKTIRGDRFRAEAAKLPGVDTAQAGTVMTLTEAFPELAASAGGGAAPRRRARA